MCWNNETVKPTLVWELEHCIQVIQCTVCRIWGFHGSDYENAVFLDVAPCGFTINRCFGRTCRLHLQCKRNNVSEEKCWVVAKRLTTVRSSSQSISNCLTLFLARLISSTLKMEATISVFQPVCFQRGLWYVCQFHCSCSPTCVAVFVQLRITSDNIFRLWYIPHTEDCP
jgi:hypothetical protein